MCSLVAGIVPAAATAVATQSSKRLLSDWAELAKPSAVISNLLAVAGIVFGLYFWWEARARPAISYEVSTIKVVEKASTDSIRVLDNDGNQLTDNVYAAEVMVWNSGNSPADLGLVRSPVEIVDETSAHLLEASKGVHHARAEAIEPDECQPIRIRQPQAPRRTSAQYVHLMAENKVLSFEPASRLHKRRQPMQQQFDHP